jgi:hypothetical protein
MRRARAARFRYPSCGNRGEPDRSGAVILQFWATPAQMVAMARVDAQCVAGVDSLLGEIQTAK